MNCKMKAQENDVMATLFGCYYGHHKNTQILDLKNKSIALFFFKPHFYLTKSYLTKSLSVTVCGS